MATAPAAALAGFVGTQPAAAPAAVTSVISAPITVPVPDVMAPLQEPRPVDPALQAVEASFYGEGFAGRPTANGETFNPAEMTAAHRTLPFGTLVKVTDQATGQEVTVRINDRGPFHGNREIDLSEGAARALGMMERGTAMVSLETIGRA